MKLQPALAQCSSGLLHKIAYNRGLPTDAATLRLELVDRLTDVLAHASSSGELWARLAPEERVPIDRIVRAGGRHPAELLERRLRGVSSGSAGTEAADPAGVLAQLLERGIIFRVFEGESATPGTAYVLPDEYLTSARVSVEGSASAVRPTGVTASDVRQNDPRLDWFILASALRREIWNLPKRHLGGKPGPRLDQLLARLRAAIPAVDDRAERERWTFFVRLGRRLGWLRAQGWPRPDDQAVERILREPIPAVRQLWAAYVRDPDLAASRQIRAEAPRRQRDLLLVLGDLSDADWYRWEDLASVLASALSEGETVQPAAGAAPDRGPSPRSPGVADPDTAQLRGWLTGPWWWLGLVRWGSERGAWTVVSPTATLATLGDGAPDAPSDPSPCRLGDDLELIAPLTAELATLYHAERYLRYLGGVAPRRYRLTATTFGRGVRLGGSVEEATGLLERLQQGSLGAPWLDALGRWTTALGTVRLDARLVLSAIDPETLQRLLGVPGVLDGVDEVLSDRHASIAAPELERLLLRLGEAGISVDLSAGVRLNPGEPARAAAFGADAAATLWLILQAFEQVDRGLLEELGGVVSIRDGLESVIPTETRASLERRADALAARLAAKRGAGGAR